MKSFSYFPETLTFVQTIFSLNKKQKKNLAKLV